MPPKQKKKKKKGGNIGKHNTAAREDAGEVASPPSFEFAKGNNFGDDFKVVGVWCNRDNRDGKGWVVKFTYTHTFTTTQKSSMVRLPATNFKEKFKTAIHKAHLEYVAEVEELANRQSDHMDSLESAVQNDTSNPLVSKWLYVGSKWFCICRFEVVLPRRLPVQLRCPQEECAVQPVD